MLHLDTFSIVLCEDEDQIGAFDCSFLKLDGTEHDDDEDGDIMQNKLLILVAQVVKTSTYAATCLQMNGVSERATHCHLQFVELVFRGSPAGERA